MIEPRLFHPSRKTASEFFMVAYCVVAIISYVLAIVLLFFDHEKYSDTAISMFVVGVASSILSRIAKRELEILP